MDTAGFWILLVAILGTGLHGCSCMLSSSPRRPLSVGFLDLLLCAVLVGTSLLLRSGALVIATEFGALMAQGAVAVWFVRIALVICAGLPVLCWRRVKDLNLGGAPNPQRARLGLSLTISVAVGAWAASRLVTLNPAENPVLHVSMFDVWWPPLVVWQVFCLSRIMLALSGAETLFKSLTLCAAILAPAGRFALVHQELFDPQSRAMWKVLEPLSLLVAVCLVGAKYLAPRPGLNRWKKTLIPLAAAAALMAFVFSGDTVKLTVDLILPVMLLGGILIAILMQKGANESTEQLALNETTRTMRIRQAIDRIREAATHSAIAGLVFAILLLILPAFLIDVLSIGFLDRDLDLAILTLFWLGFSARLAAGELNQLPKPFTGGVIAFWPHLKPLLKKAGDRAADAQKRVFALVKGVGSGGATAVAARSIFLTLASLLALVAVSQVLNYGKLVVEPFDWKGKGTDDAKVADRVSAGVVNSLSEMRRDLTPILLIAPAGEKHGSDFRVQAAILDNGALESAVEKGSDVQLSKVSIPLAVLTAPIERLVQWALNIRVVGGSIHTTQDGNYYVAIVDSGRDESFRVYGRLAGGKPTADAAEPVASTAATGAKETTVSGVKNVADDGEECTPEAGSEDLAKSGPKDPMDAEIDEVAFHVASSDPTFVAMGLTRSWAAYGYFRKGLKRWSCYDAHEHWSDLMAAIRFFRKSEEEDRSFAPAAYRLGLAFQAARQMDNAIEAYKRSVAANPSLSMARIAEAQVLSNYSQLPPVLPAGVNFPPRKDRSSEARSIWAGIIGRNSVDVSRGDLLYAYFGLCTSPYESRDREYGLRYPHKFYLAYFTCSQAQAEYLDLPRVSRDAPEQRKLEAAILEYLGDYLNFHDSTEKTVAIAAPNSESLPLWGCGEWMLDPADLFANGKATKYEIQGSLLTPHAQRYYRASLELIPDDDYVICQSAAAAAYEALSAVERRKGGPEDAYEGFQGAMAELNSSATAHLALAGWLEYDARILAQDRNPDQWGDWGASHPEARMKLAPMYYSRSLNEAWASILRSPTDPSAQNLYAETVWEWWVDAKDGRLADLGATGGSGPGLPFTDEMRAPDAEAWQAEFYARNAVRLYKLRHDAAGVIDAKDSLRSSLIMQGRSSESLETLGELEASDYDFYGFDELQWGFAQASVCAAMEETGSAAQKHLKDAARIMETIRKHEMAREVRPFTTTPRALDLKVASTRCAAPPDKDKRTPVWGIAYDGKSFHPAPGCESVVVVTAEVKGTPSANGPLNPLVLLISGEGVGELNEQQGLSAQLEPPDHAHRVYFAQVVESQLPASQPGSRRPFVSPVVSFDVPVDKGNGSCPDGEITLEFKFVNTGEKGKVQPNLP